MSDQLPGDPYLPAESAPFDPLATMTCPMCGETVRRAELCPLCGEPLTERVERPEYKLYSIGGVMIATFLASMFAGGVILAINFHRLGKSGAALAVGAGSLALTVALMLVSIYILPENFPAMGLLIPQMAVAYGAAKGMQDKALTAHADAGGEIASNWRAAGVSLLSLLILLPVVVGIIFIKETIAPTPGFEF